MSRYLPLAAAFAGLVVSASATAADGTITFNGLITDNTCEVSVNSSGANGTVMLPTIQASALPSVGSTAGTVPFNILLSNCAGTTLNTASTFFEAGASVDSSTGRLDTTGSADNVQLQLLNSAHGVIAAGAITQNDVPVDISSGSGTLDYYVQYYATGAVVPGTVTSMVNFSIVYD